MFATESKKLAEASSVGVWEWLGEDGERPVFKGIAGYKGILVVKAETINRNGFRSVDDCAQWHGQVARSILVTANLQCIAAGPFSGALPEVMLYKKQPPAFVPKLKKQFPSANLIESPLPVNFDPFNIWYCMGYVDGLKDFGIPKKDKPGWKQDLRNTLTSNTFECFGRIAAADFFSGNTDRFLAVPDGGRYVYGFGNLFMLGDGTGVGLDFFDPNSCFHDFYHNHTVDEWEKHLVSVGYGDKWPGYILCDPQAVQTMCNTAVQEICSHIELTDTALIEEYTKRFRKGIFDGMTEIQASFLGNIWRNKRYLSGGNPPIQLQLRARALGWTCNLWR